MSNKVYGRGYHQGLKEGHSEIDPLVALVAFVVGVAVTEFSNWLKGKLK